MSLLIAGSFALDTIEAGGKKVKDVPGGSAMYASVAASFLTKPAVLSAIGKDFPKKYLAVLKKHGIDVSDLKIIDGKTFRWSGRYSCDFNRAKTLGTKLHIFENFKPELSKNSINSEYVLLANADPQMQTEVLKQMKNVKISGLDTMNLWIKTKREKLKKLLTLVDVLFVNEDEAKQLTKKNNLLSAAKELQKKGPQTLIIKRGEFGAVLFKKNEMFCVPSYPLEKITDTTGAGDTFAGAFFSYIASAGRYDLITLKQAMIYATVMSSFNIESFSAQRFEKLTKKEITSRINRLQKITEL